MANTQKIPAVIIAFDIHGVLFAKDYHRIAHLLWCNKWHLVPLAFYAFHPGFIKALIKLHAQRPVTQAYLLELSHKFKDLQKLIPLGIAIANAQKPLPKTIAIAHRLKNAGFTLHIVSNIGDVIYADLATKNQALFTLFDTVITPSQATAHKGKKHRSFFERYVQQFPDKMIYLIDDNNKNLQRAAKTGIHGIHVKDLSRFSEILIKQANEQQPPFAL